MKMNIVLSAIAALSVAQLGAMASLFEPSHKETSRRLTEAQRKEMRQATVDYWKSIGKLVNKAGYKENDPVYKRTVANLARAQYRLAKFGGQPAPRHYNKRQVKRAHAYAAKKSMGRESERRALARKEAAKKAPAKAVTEETPHKKSLMEKLFG